MSNSPIITLLCLACVIVGYVFGGPAGALIGWVFIVPGAMLLGLGVFVLVAAVIGCLEMFRTWSVARQ